jgi:hypothetical protein
MKRQHLPEKTAKITFKAPSILIGLNGVHGSIKLSKIDISLE